MPLGAGSHLSHVLYPKVRHPCWAEPSAPERQTNAPHTAVTPQQHYRVFPAAESYSDSPRRGQLEETRQVYRNPWYTLRLCSQVGTNFHKIAQVQQQNRPNLCPPAPKLGARPACGQTSSARCPVHGRRSLYSAANRVRARTPLA